MFRSQNPAYTLVMSVFALATTNPVLGLYCLLNVILMLQKGSTEVMAEFYHEIDLKTVQVGITTFINAGGNSTIVSYIPDLNGDNLAEILIGAYQASPQQRQSAGCAYLIWGNASFPKTVDLAQWNTSNLGVRFDGAASGDRLGYSLTSVPDINGDKKPELLIGAYLADSNKKTDAGSVYLIWGNASLPSVIDLAKWNSTRLGIRYDGTTAGGGMGVSVASIEDINNDQLSELIVGAPESSFIYINSTRTQAGLVYLIWGNPKSPTIVDMNQFTQKNLGIIFFGAASGDSFGYSVNSLSDLNGDNKSELIIGASTASPQSRNFAGSVYLIWGNATLPVYVDLAEWDKNLLGIRFDGANSESYTGIHVARYPDLNEDNHDEIIITAAYASPKQSSYAGSTFIIWGNSTLPHTVDLSQWEINQWGIRFDGPISGENSGIWANSISDLNDDNKAELLIGAYVASPELRQQAGKVYLLWGNQSLSSVVNLVNLNDESLGIVFDGANQFDATGAVVSNLPDLSKDNRSEILISADGTDKAYLVFSEALIFTPTTLAASTTPKGKTTISLDSTTTVLTKAIEAASPEMANYTIPAVAGGTVAAMLCCVGLFGGAYFVLRRRQAVASRQGTDVHTTAARIIYERLNINGVANFNSAIGMKFIEQVKDINEAYQRVNGMIGNTQEYTAALASSVRIVLTSDPGVIVKNNSLSFNISDVTRRQPLHELREEIIDHLSKSLLNDDHNDILVSRDKIQMKNLH